jgi:hypothetical protein
MIGLPELLLILSREKSQREELEKFSEQSKELQEAMKEKQEVLTNQYMQAKILSDTLYDIFYKPGEDGKTYVDSIISRRREVKAKIKTATDSRAIRELKESLEKWDEELKKAKALLTYGKEVRVPELYRIGQKKQQEAEAALRLAKAEDKRVKHYIKEIDPYPY